MNSVFMESPSDFQSKVSVAGCYCEFEDKILLLKRTSHKHQGDTWGIPGGKIDEGETPRIAVIREVYEEVGIYIKEDEPEEIDKMYIRGPLNDYIFYRFRMRFTTLPVIDLSLEEHVEARWLTVDEALTFPLIYGGIEALMMYKKFMESRNQ